MKVELADHGGLKIFDGDEYASEGLITRFGVCVMPKKRVAIGIKVFLWGMGSVWQVIADLRTEEECTEIRNLMRAGAVRQAFYRIAEYHNRPLQVKPTEAVKKK